MGCQDIQPLLSFIFVGGVWQPNKTREQCQEEAQTEGMSHVILWAGEGHRIDLLLKHRDYRGENR